MAIVSENYLSLFFFLSLNSSKSMPWSSVVSLKLLFALTFFFLNGFSYTLLNMHTIFFFLTQNKQNRGASKHFI